MDDDDPRPAPLAPVTLPESGTGERARRRLAAQQATARSTAPTAPAATRTHRRLAFALALAVLVGAVPVLVFVGYSSVLNTTSGRSVDPVDDPALPGYEANVSPTPVQLVAELGPDGRLVGGVVLSLTSPTGGGSLLFLPAGTTAPTATGGGTLASAYESGSLDGFRRAVAGILRTGFDGVAAMDPARWAQLLAPVAPLAVNNPDRLPAAAGAPAFASGAIELVASDVGAFLAARRSGESDLNRISRQQLVWEAWLTSVAAKGGPAVIPGETSTGFGRFLAALAAGSRSSVVLPVAAITDGSVPDGFAAQSTGLADLLARLIPFPTSDQPGDRIRVRILDGSGVRGLSLAAARVLVPAGAEVAIVGNADRFDHQVTQVLGVGDAGAAAAAVLQQALGVGSVAPNDVLDDVVEVTVILGADFADRAGLSTTTTVTGGGVGG